jgi:3D (Asp-Asp-Asp) domain-containing protein
MELKFDLPEPADGDLGDSEDIWGTYYYSQFAREAPGGIPIRSVGDATIGPAISRKDWCLAAMEGTVVVQDSQGNLSTYNYAGRGISSQASCRDIFPNLNAAILAGTEHSRWQEARGPYGDGAANLVLVPYRSLAVDRTMFSLGTALYIAAARGRPIVLPDGSRATHDGYFFAADVGGAIRGNHCDFFLGTTSKNPFPFVTSSKQDTFPAVTVTNTQTRAYLKGLHTL